MEIIKVAIVEDENDIRETLHILVKDSSGFNCDNAFSSAEDALIVLPEKDIDVVIMDIDLPGMNGIDCVSLLKDKMPRTQFMMFTVYADDDKIFDALKSGASGYIVKRTPPSQILEAISELYLEGAPMSSEIARRVIEFMRTKKLTDETKTLTVLEGQILDYLSKGYLYKEIAAEFFISQETVKKHIHNIYTKLHAQSRIDAVTLSFMK